MVPIKENFWNFQTRENRVICKVRKTQHQNSEFRHTQGEIFKKKLPKKYISIQWGKKPQKSINYGDKMSFFANTIERGDRGWKEAQRQGEDRVPLRITQILTKVKSTDGIVRQVICNKKVCKKVWTPNSLKTAKYLTELRLPYQTGRVIIITFFSFWYKNWQRIPVSYNQFWEQEHVKPKTCRDSDLVYTHDARDFAHFLVWYPLPSMYRVQTS